MLLYLNLVGCQIRLKVAMETDSDYANTIFSLAALNVIVAAQAFYRRRRNARAIDNRTPAEKRTRKMDRHGRKSSKEEPEWKKSYFWRLLLRDGIKDPTTSDAKEFRRLFRVPFALVQWMTDLAEEKQWDPKARVSAFGIESVPLMLKIVSVF